ncbi:MAG: hypothetical protein JO306_01885 [Gemmatimonadetes bacterium]|nr:hypothetical protein [Gemmatimonadota bacterium]
MKKLSLKVDEIDVSSFVADELEGVIGTVDANDAGLTVPPRCGGTVMAGNDGDDQCTSGCVCCRFRPAPKPI